MVTPNSRYAGLPTYVVTTATGQQVAVLSLPLPPTAPTRLAGFYQRPAGERLDLVAARFLGDPAAFWRLCDANNCVNADALAARPMIGIPA